MLKDSPFHIKNFDQFIEVRQQIIKDDKNHGKNQYVSPVAEEIKQTIKDLDSKGWSYAKIAEKLNTTRSAISGIVYREKGTRKCKGKYD